MATQSTLPHNMAPRPKVAHLTSVHPWNDTRIYRRMCTALAEGGYDVHWVVPCNNLPAEAQDLGVTVHPLAEPTGGNRFDRMTRTVQAVLQEALRLDAELYHLHDPELLRIGLTLRKRGKLVIHDAHEDLPATIVDTHWIPKPVGRVMAGPAQWLLRRWCGRMSAIIGAEQEITDSLKHPGQPAISIHNYPRLSEFPAPTDWSPRHTSGLLVSFGGLNSHRCADQVVSAASLLEPQYDYRLLVAGRSEGEVFVNRLRQFPAYSRLEYPGMIGREQLKQYLYQARMAFVLYSYSPNHLRVRSNRFFEAMAAGVPVITADFPHWREMVGKIGCGLTVKSDDPTAIAGAIRRLWNDPDEAELMGRRGREAVEHQYCWEREKQHLVGLYRQLLGR